ncbi:MAG: bifunctional UDP-N-acetylglucosamine diphosphorylase/glucosamine-1-phosphate N-acetyltransferase GlmU [Burkholderiaceae bacterium]|nr:bifunctional UDP-N-acetylglucosamine diphosphorylase/glucosamine-1-phosphate N-acetyltransferase GlmU [Burkholderiaceae bacterium]
MNIVILAAGMGKRMRSALPKVLHPLAGKPLLQHVVDEARGLDPETIVVVYGHGGETVSEAIAGDDLHWVLQQPQLGTGHAVQQAAPLLADNVPTLVLYGDVPLIRAETLDRLVQAAGNDALALLTVELDDPAGYGRIVRRDGRIVCIVEHRDADAAQRDIREINTGILVAPTPALKRWLAALGNDNAQGEYYLTDIVASAVHDGVRVASAQPVQASETLGVNSKLQLARLERLFQARLAERLMEEDGVRLADPTRLDVRGRLRCGRDVFIDVGCVFEGDVELGDCVEIGPYCTIRSARIGAGTRILPYSNIDDAVVGANARIGPFARLRPGTELGDATHVGNFVEIKNTKMRAGSKANHLAYIGDASIGERVNLGAGTITCNYDGVNKYETVIGDDAFIGSDTQLVAPVSVGRGATIGAGTTLTEDAPEGRLTLSRTKQVTIDSWKRPARKNRQAG